MHCPNCGLANDSSARFCANCGTPLGEGLGQGPVSEPIPMPPTPAQGPYSFQPPQGAGNSLLGGGNSTLKNIGIGCLVAIALVLFVGLSCTRACFGHRRGYVVRHY